jgi:hypothetical protein
MARREEGEYSTYSTDEQRRQRAKDQARWLQNVAVEALARRTHDDPVADGRANHEATTSRRASLVGCSRAPLIRRPFVGELVLRPQRPSTRHWPLTP